MQSLSGTPVHGPSLAGYLKEAVTLSLWPRDVAELGVFYRNRFLCRAVSPEHSGLAVTLKGIQAARSRGTASEPAVVRPPALCRPRLACLVSSALDNGSGEF